MKTSYIHVRATEETRGKLVMLAEHYRRSQADQIAWMIDCAVRDMQASKKEDEKQ